MTIIEIGGDRQALTARQYWAHNLVFVFVMITFIIGVSLRENILHATWLYTNTEAGIRAEYPQNWLIDSQGNYVFRVRDTSKIGYPTTIQVAVQPVAPETSARYIFDGLTLNRSQTLASYSVLSSGAPLTLADETVATTMNYTFAATGNDPFLETVPVVVRGQDILAVRRGQAVIITFLSEATTYDQNYAIFAQFLDNLEF